MPSPLKFAVLASGSGTTLQNFIDQIDTKKLDAKIELVIGSKPGLVALDRAAKANIPREVAERKSFADLQSFSRRVFQLIDSASVDLVCLAGWLCLLDVPEKWLGKVINIHPALLPSFGGKGMYGQRVHQAVIDHGCKVSGCTVHFVDNTYDNGPIILQRTCPVLDNDTADALAHRVFDAETIAYPEAIRLFAQNRLTIHGRRVMISSNQSSK